MTRRARHRARRASVFVMGGALAAAVAVGSWAGEGGRVDGRAAGEPAGEPGGASADTVPEPAGYRMDDYDAPVPDGLAGARTVGAVEVAALLAAGALVIDVVPAHRPPADLPEGQLWLPPPHAGIPGALWLPDTGFGALAPVTERYLLTHLERASGGDRARDVVFYCRIDCWMSWNAAKRALAAGHERVHWFRDGIDDWRFEGYPLVTLVPAPGERLPGLSAPRVPSRAVDAID